MNTISDKEIVNTLNELREIANKSYSPYSNFRVSSLLVTKEGNKRYKGVNIENASFPAGICAERSSIFSAVTDGEKKFSHIIIHSPDAKEILPPCGQCRQVMLEFFDRDTKIIMSNKDLSYVVATMEEIMPFSLDELKGLKNE